MQFFVGIDVSLESSSICVIDERGIIIKEGKVESDPQSVAKFIRHKGRKIEHVGLEAGQLSEWLFVGLSKEGFKVSVLESRHVRAAFAAMRVKTDRNDARGIAQLIRLGWFKSVHVKTLNARETRATLNARQFLVDKITAIENTIRSSLRNFGLKMGQVTRRGFAPRARELADGSSCLQLVTGSLLKVRETLLDELKKLDRKLIDAARADPVTQMLMTAPGVGAIVALTFRNAVDDPGRFAKVKSIGPWLGLTPRRYQSGETESCDKGRRPRDTNGIVRGSNHVTRPERRMVDTQAVGPTHRCSTRNQEGPCCCCRTKARCYSALHVAEQLPIPMVEPRRRSMTYMQGSHTSSLWFTKGMTPPLSPSSLA